MVILVRGTHGWRKYSGSGDINATANDQIVPVCPVVQWTGFGWREFDELVKGRGPKPVHEFLDCVMRLVLRAVPVKRIADTILPDGMVGEVHDFVQREV